MEDHQDIQYQAAHGGVTYRLRYARTGQAQSYLMETTDATAVLTTRYTFMTRSGEWVRSLGEDGEVIDGATVMEVQHFVGAFCRIVGAVGVIPLP